MSLAVELDHKIIQMRAAVINAICKKRRLHPMTERVESLLLDDLTNTQIFKIILREQPWYIKLRLNFLIIVKVLYVALACSLIGCAFYRFYQLINVLDFK